MKNLCYLLLGCLLASCSTVRQLERAQKFVAAHQAAVPPDTVFMQLMAANPKLKERTTRTITKVVQVHDTVRILGKTVYLPAPARAPNPLVDSLIRAAGKQLRVKDSLAFAMRLRAALAARPRVRTDTLRQRVGNVLVLTWIDKAGAWHMVGTNVKTDTVVVQQVIPAPPRPAARRTEAAPPCGFWGFVNLHLGAIVAVLLICLLWLLLFLFVRRRRDRRALAYFPAPYSHKP